MATESSQIGRRSFLSQILILAFSALAGAMAWGAVQFAVFRTGKKRIRRIPSDVVASLQPDTPVHVAAAGVWLLKSATGEGPHALEDRCTHLGCAVKWNAQRSLFECPCHGSQFDATGHVKHGPATRSLPQFSLKQGEDGTVRLVERPPASVPASS